MKEHSNSDNKNKNKDKNNKRNNNKITTLKKNYIYTSSGQYSGLLILYPAFRRLKSL